jgi:class 3 adenylate cyclase/tetratricopeptide (TPR) repeat protein
MLCPACEHDNPPHGRFCTACGETLPVPCPECHSLSPDGARFYGRCGRDLSAAARARPPRGYGHLTERMLLSRWALEGERKHVTVLFADLKDSMEMLAGRDPEEAEKILNAVLEMLMNAVHRYEGTVNQVLGDGIMALFGAPIAQEDHAVRACYAALAMQAATRIAGGRLTAAYGIDVQVRVGINSGEVVVRPIGSDLHMGYTAVGQTTHLAARMEQLADPGTVLISAETLQLAHGYVEARPLGARAVKGLTEPILAFELVGARPSRTRWQTRVALGLTPFVGRRAELATLSGVLERVAASHGHIGAVVGDPGVGKSRLVWEFTRRHFADGGLVLEGGCAPYGRTTAWLPVRELLENYFEIESHDDGARVQARVRSRLTTADPQLLPFTTAFLGLLDAPVEDRAWAGLDPDERRQRSRQALTQLLVAESLRQPTVLVIEDLQWIDAESQAFLENLVDQLPPSRLLLLVTYRPEYRHGWARLGYYVEVPVLSLQGSSADELVKTLLGGDPSLTSVRHLVVHRTEGNPFFAEESVRTLAESGALAGAHGAYRLARPVSAVQMPATVQAVLAARIDRLPPEEKRLLQTAAVIGRDVSLPLLGAVAVLPDEAVRRQVTNLKAAEFVHERQLFPEIEYTFKHAVTHEVVYHGLRRERQRTLHAQVLGAIETLYAARLAEYVDRLAHHALLGGVWDKALVYLRQAGARAVARSAHSEAVTCFTRALETLRHLPESRERTTQAIDLRLLRANSLVPLAEFGPIIEDLREAERLAQALDDQARLGRVSSFLSAYFWLVGDQLFAVDHGRRALDVASRLDDRGLRVRTNISLGQAYHVLGEYRKALEVLGSNVDELQGDLLGRRFGLVGVASVLSRAWMVWCLAELGEFDLALTRGEEAIRIAEAVEHPYSILAAYFGVGGVHLRRGDVTRAISVLERALDLGRTWDTQLRLWFLGVAPSLGHAYALAGEPVRAIPLLEKAMERATATRLMFAQSLRAGWLAHAYLAAGRLAEARAFVGDAIGLARRHRERGHEAWIQGIVGDIAAQGDPPDLAAAETAYRDGMQTANDLGMRPRLACCHLGLGKLYRRAGKTNQALEHLTAAAQLFDAMAMPLWREETASLLAALDTSTDMAHSRPKTRSAGG